MFSLSKHRYAIALVIAKNVSLCGFVIKRCARYARHHCINCLCICIVNIVVIPIHREYDSKFKATYELWKSYNYVIVLV